MASIKHHSAIQFVFESMDYGIAIESDGVVKDWLQSHKNIFAQYVNGKFTEPISPKTAQIKTPITGELLATIHLAEKSDIDNAVASATEAYKKWNTLAPHTRARHLYSIARHVQKHQQLLTVLETINNGKNIRESRDYDVPNVVRSFYHHAGWAQLLDVEMKQWKSLGVVAVILPWNFPIMHLSWIVAPAIATGNTVVIKPASYTPLSAFLFAEICKEAGLPDGVVNVVTGEGQTVGRYLASHPGISKVSFIGSREVGKDLRRVTSGTGKRLSVELGGKSALIVFDSADLDAAVEGVIDGMFFNNGQVCCAASRLLVQETVFDTVIANLKLRMGKLRIGHSLEKTVDLSAIVSKTQIARIDAYVAEAEREGAQIYRVDYALPSIGNFYPPTLITGVNPGARVVMEEVFGPVLVALPFRTAKEAVALANNTSYGLAASVWTESAALALEVAKGLQVGTVWVNTHNVFDAASGFGGCRQSGFGRCGGKECLYEYMQPVWQEPFKHRDILMDIKKFAAEYRSDIPSTVSRADNECAGGDSVLIDKTYKLYIGGAQKRPDGNGCRTILNEAQQVIGQVGESSRKDVRNAVEAASKAQPGWAKRSGHNRAQILYYIAENFETRRDEFIRQLVSMTGQSADDAGAEFDVSIRRLFQWAAYCDKHGGNVQETNFGGLTMRLNEAVGTVGICCPDKYPLLAFVSLVAAAIARGSAVIVTPSDKCPLAALDMYQVFDTSDLPGGVVNILTGSRDHIARQLAEHHDVDALWYFGSAEGSKMVEYASAENMKVTWVNHGIERNWVDPIQNGEEEYLLRSTHVKNIWIPAGESFSN